MFLYHIRFEKYDEAFDKIGISIKSPFYRFAKGEYKGYKMKILDLEELPDKECKAKEKALHKKFKEFQYFPLTEGFSGYTECFDIDCVTLKVDLL